MATAGMLAVMSGILRIAMGIARLGILVNFVSDSVIVGFTAGAGVLVAVGGAPTCCASISAPRAFWTT